MFTLISNVYANCSTLYQLIGLAIIAEIIFIAIILAYRIIKPICDWLVRLADIEFDVKISGVKLRFHLRR